MRKNRVETFILSLVFVYLVFFIPYIILDHSEPFTYKDFLKVIPTTIIGLVTVYIAYQQHILAKQQKDISNQQKNIAANKLRLELFEKKCEIYEIHLNMALWVSKIQIEKNEGNSSLPLDFDGKWKKSKTYEKNFLENEDKLISLGEQVRFLFDLEMYTFLAGMRAEILSLQANIKLIRNLKKEEKREKENPLLFIDASTRLSLEAAQRKIRLLNVSIENFYSQELPERMMPYLKMPEDISKDEI
ncbi:hypothetical protein [Acetobacter pasteurianus]|uniref:Uncharacterized protein n=1 Tax=Acetobacter pasteurianus subsp. pasteurianus TaxID=481145 RepID=A0A1Y0Y4Q4_ACEPA|nr:hypothetical protein [Acetobacter pasteurianus]ARW47437.1 hypothetical protein S1001342_01098 [Acetobacter pasteurianus subsp. pasteurianus]